MDNDTANLLAWGANSPRKLRLISLLQIILRNGFLVLLISLLIIMSILSGCTSSPNDTDNSTEIADVTESTSQAVEVEETEETTETDSEDSSEATSTEEVDSSSSDETSAAEEEGEEDEEEEDEEENSNADSASVDPDDLSRHFIFDASNFVDPTTSTNEYHPLRPGMQWIRTGTTEVGSREVPLQVISTMTDVIRIIDGVPTVAMLDQSTDSGEIAQVGIDYFALDKDGNVWLMGGYTEEFEGGEFTNLELAWLGTETGGQPGVLVPGTVTMETARWYIGTSGEDENPTAAEPVQVGIDVSVAFGDFQNVIAIMEGAVGEIDNEIKYYAPGVGVVLNEPQDASLHQDRFELINFVELSEEGLAEASQIVFDLEAHALELVPEVYGDAPPSERKQP